MQDHRKDSRIHSPKDDWSSVNNHELDTKGSHGRGFLSGKTLRFAAYVALGLAALCLTGCCCCGEGRTYNREGRAIQQMEFNRMMGYDEYYGTWDMGLLLHRPPSLIFKSTISFRSAFRYYLE